MYIFTSYFKLLISLLGVTKIVSVFAVIGCELRALANSSVLVSAMIRSMKHVSKVMSLDVSACVQATPAETVTTLSQRICAAVTHVMWSFSFWEAEERTMKVLLLPVLRISGKSLPFW
jgi:hypothetical protein